MQQVMINHPDHASDFHTPRYCPLDWQREGLSKTATGYGTKIPTTYVLDYMGRARRIYTDIYSNVGRSYIIVNKQKVSVC